MRENMRRRGTDHNMLGLGTTVKSGPLAKESWDAV